MESNPVKSSENIDKLEIESHNHQSEQEKKTSYYSATIDKIGFCTQTWIVFITANLLQSVWGCETAFVAMYLENYGVNSSIKTSILSLSICIIYSMLGLGSSMVGILSSKIGRVKALESSALTYILSIGICSFIDNFYLILIFRCIGNVSIGVFNILIINLLSEFLPTKSRSFILMFDSGFFNIGNLYTIILKLSFPDKSLNSFDLFNFRMINLLNCIPGFFAFLFIFFKLTESPLYLITKSNEEKGMNILEEMANCKNVILSSDQKELIFSEIKKRKSYKLGSSYKELFNSNYFKTTVLCILINLICYFNLIGVSYLTPKTFKTIKESRILSENMVLLVFGLLQLPNGPVGGWMTESKVFKRKLTMLISSLLCGVFYLLSYFFINLVCFFSGLVYFFNSIAFGCSFIYVTEVFPTNLRDHAQSFIQFFAFFIGSWSPLLIDWVASYDLLYNYIYFSISCIVCGVISTFLPIDTYERPLDEDVNTEVK
jgi:MFS family permease